jgi:hypothetical protein
VTTTMVVNVRRGMAISRAPFSRAADQGGHLMRPEAGARSRGLR